MRRRDGGVVAVESLVSSVAIAGRTLRVAVLRDTSGRMAAQAAADRTAAAEFVPAQDTYRQLFDRAPVAMV